MAAIPDLWTWCASPDYADKCIRQIDACSLVIRSLMTPFFFEKSRVARPRFTMAYTVLWDAYKSLLGSGCAQHVPRPIRDYSGWILSSAYAYAKSVGWVEPSGASICFDPELVAEFIEARRQFGAAIVPLIPELREKSEFFWASYKNRPANPHPALMGLVSPMPSKEVLLAALSDAYAGDETAGPDPIPSTPEISQPKGKTRRRRTKGRGYVEARALDELRKEPNLSIEKLASIVGCDPRSLRPDRAPSLAAYREACRRYGAPPPRGFKDADGTIDAWEPGQVNREG